MGRLRTAAIFTSGAVVASALAVVQPWIVGAAPGDLDTTYVPIEPCRIIDTRPAPDTVGSRTAPLGPKEIYPVQVTGSQGDCVGIPADATAVAMNVTAVGGTAASFLTLFPSDLAAPPNAANLNWLPGAPPTPNKVDVKLSPGGEVSLYNENGTVIVIADVAGYYTPSSLTDLEERLAALEIRDATVDARIRDAIPSTTTRKSGDQTITAAWTEVVSITNISLSRSGNVIAFASATAVEFEGGTDVKCVITDRISGFPDDNNMRWEAAGTTNSESGEGDAGNLAGVETFDVEGGETGSFYLFCRNQDADIPDGNSEIWDPEITLLFIPDR